MIMHRGYYISLREIPTLGGRNWGYYVPGIMCTSYTPPGWGRNKKSRIMRDFLFNVPSCGDLKKYELISYTLHHESQYGRSSRYRLFHKSFDNSYLSKYSRYF